jgi:hypothetical protein
MATKKTTTRGKTKTTKTSAAATKTAKTAKKVTKTAVKAPAKKVAAAKTTTKKTLSVFDRLVRWQLVSALVFIALAIGAGTAMKTTTSLLSFGHMGRDSLASRTETIYASAQEPVFDLEIRWALVTILGVAAVFSLLYLTRLKAQYNDSLNTKVFKWRWIEMAITSALMVELVAVLSGAEDIATLKLIGGFMIVAAALGWVVERDTAAKRPVRAALIISIVAAVLPWLLIAMYAIATFVYGGIRSPWYVYALYAVSIAGGLLVTRNLRRTTNSQVDRATTERDYTVISFVTKAAFAAVLIIGLKR